MSVRRGLDGSSKRPPDQRDLDRDRVGALASSLDLPAPDDRLLVSSSSDLFGSPYDVTGAAVASVGAAVWAVAAFDAARRGSELATAEVDATHAAMTFHSERLLRIDTRPDVRLWDTVSGNYATRDGWVRLHTVLRSHREAALRALESADDRAAVTAAAAARRTEDLADAVISAGGVATAMRSREQWQTHPQANALANLPLVGLEELGPGRTSRPGRLLEGIRVLDLTRVIAGPVAGRFLAAFGADVLRVDAPLDDAELLEIDTGVGKRRASLDLTDAADRRRFEDLLAEADVLLSAFRPGALDGIGYDLRALESHRAGLVVGQLSAYGDAGPWRDRRGFDSVVQVAVGIAHTCGFDADSGPSALPAQALDHASGYLLAAGVVAALARRVHTGRGHRVAVALARTADWLESLGTRPGRTSHAPTPQDAAPYLARWEETDWGPVDHVRPVGTVGGRAARWERPPVPRGTHESRWAGTNA